jgi:hypothetical protein
MFGVRVIHSVRVIYKNTVIIFSPKFILFVSNLVLLLSLSSIVLIFGRSSYLFLIGRPT